MTIVLIRQKIAELKQERIDVEAIKLSRHEVKALIDTWLADTEAAGTQALLVACQQAQAGRPLTPATVQGNAAVYQSPGAAPFSIDLGPLLLSVLGKGTIKKAIQPLLDYLPEGLDAPARAQRLAEIDAELLKLEIEEEAAIVGAEEAGETILRRPDARPDIVLAD